MKLVQDLPEIFEEFGEKRREAFLEVKEYKDKHCGNIVEKVKTKVYLLLECIVHIFQQSLQWR